MKLRRGVYVDLGTPGVSGNNQGMSNLCVLTCVYSVLGTFVQSPSNYFLSDLIGNVLTQSHSFRGLSRPQYSPLARSAGRGDRVGHQSVFPYRGEMVEISGAESV